MAKNTGLVAGPLSVVVRATMTYLADKPDWDVIGLPRRAPDFQTATRFLQLDLTDSTACREALHDLTNITHVFYCA